MKTYTELKQRLSTMGRDELEATLANVVISLFGVAAEDPQDGNIFDFTAEKDWGSDTVDDVYNDLHSAGLIPDVE